MKTIAITNDDGYTEGALVLLRVAKKHADAYAILPDRQRSAISSALTLHKPLRLHERAENVYTFSGTPADCVIFAVNSKAVETPDVILSGINWGDNSGMTPLISSGTIGACWRAAIYNIPAIAFSIYRESHADRLGWMKKENWHSELLEKKTEEVFSLLKDKLKPGNFFVVNMPSFSNLEKAKIVFPEKLHGLRFKAEVEERKDPYGHPYYWIRGNERHPEEGNDLYEIEVNGNISVKEFSVSKILG